ncbi:hypothetical protein QTP88_020170 [Uroleucon formosanum]
MVIIRLFVFSALRQDSGTAGVSKDDFLNINEILVVEVSVENQRVNHINNIINSELEIPEPEVDIVEEVREINIRQHFINDSDDVYKIPLVQITHNFIKLYPQQDDDNVCVVCRIAQRIHALVPCEHRVLFIDYLAQLQTCRCSICDEDFNLAFKNLVNVL